MDVKDKVIVVTGGADGIGAALCRRFAKDGARHVAVVDRNGDGAAAIAKEIGGKAYTVDVSNSAEVAAMVAAVEADLAEPSHVALFEKLRRDFTARGVDLADDQIAAEMERLLAVAREQVMAELAAQLPPSSA